MKIEGQTIQKGIPTPDNPVEIINIYKDLDYAVKIVESIRNKVTRINVPEQNKEYDIPFLNSTESQAVTTVLYKLSEYSEEINKLNNVIDRMAGTFLKTYRDWEATRYIFDNHICKKIKNPQSEEDDCYTDIYDDKACKECIKEYFMKEE